MIRKIFIAGMLLVAADPTSYAYELGTHGALTYEAYKRSVLTDDEFLKQLGVVNGENPFGQIYYDISESEAKERTRQPFEEDQTARRMPLGTRPLSLEGWLMRGAIREDDWTGVNLPGCQVIAENPQDDPYSNPPDRPSNHFYDPVHDWPLTVVGPLGKKAPDWAIGAENVFSDANKPEASRRNHFTVFDAREAMYRALTGLLQDGSEIPVPNGSNPAIERNKYWATLFRALGDIMHLVEDMAQPQHTRNDPHFGHCAPMVTGHASVYEKYIETRAAAKEFELPSGDKFIPPQLNYTGYATPRFTDYLSYFTTRQVDRKEHA